MDKPNKEWIIIPPIYEVAFVMYVIIPKENYRFSFWKNMIEFVFYPYLQHPLHIAIID